MHEKQHSFGGRAFDRYVFDFEATAAGAAAGDAGDYDAAAATLAAVGAEAGAEPSSAAPAAAEEAVAAAAEEPSAADEAAPAWAPSQEEWEGLQQQHNQLIQYVQQLESRTTATPEPPAAAPPQMPNALDDDYEERMQEYLEYKLAERDHVWEERFERIAPTVQTVQQREAAAQKDAIIDAIDVDGFDKSDRGFREGAEFFSIGLLDAVKAELGLDPSQPSARAAEVALQRGAEQFAAFAKTQREAGKSAYIAELERLKTGGEAAVSAVTGGGVEGLPPADDYDEALRRITA